MASSWEIFIVLFAVFLVIYLSFTFFKAYQYQGYLTNAVRTRGLNGSEGQTVILTCPPRQVIRIHGGTYPNLANYVCTSGGATEDQTCDPYWSSQGQMLPNPPFNASNTLDATNDLMVCDGKNTCDFVVPIKSSANVSGMCQQRTPGSNNGSSCKGFIQLIGTYDCVSL